MLLKLILHDGKLLLQKRLLQYPANLHRKQQHHLLTGSWNRAGKNAIFYIMSSFVVFINVTELVIWQSYSGWLCLVVIS